MLKEFSKYYFNCGMLRTLTYGDGSFLEEIAPEKGLLTIIL
jgi:hypothetical protein